MNIINKIFYFITSFLWISLNKVSFVKASTNTGLETTRGAAGLPTGNIETKIGDVIGLALGFVGTIFFILVIWSGFMWMTAAGNDEQIKKAQEVLKAAVIGLIIIVSAYAITRFIGEAL